MTSLAHGSDRVLLDSQNDDKGSIYGWTSGLSFSLATRESWINECVEGYMVYRTSCFEVGTKTMRGCA